MKIKTFNRRGAEYAEYAEYAEESMKNISAFSAPLRVGFSIRSIT